MVAAAILNFGKNVNDSGLDEDICQSSKTAKIKMFNV